MASSIVVYKTLDSCTIFQPQLPYPFKLFSYHILLILYLCKLFPLSKAFTASYSPPHTPPPPKSIDTHSSLSLRLNSNLFWSSQAGWLQSPMNDHGFCFTYLPMHVSHGTFQVISTGFILRLHVVV